MLTIHQRFRHAVVAAAIGGLSSLVVLPVTAHAADTLRPEVAKPLNAAQDLYRARKYQEALTKIDQAAAVPGKTPYESTMIEEMRGAAAAAAGNNAVAAQAYETLLSSGRLAGADEQRTTEALAGIYFQEKNYPQGHQGRSALSEVGRQRSRYAHVACAVLLPVERLRQCGEPAQARNRRASACGSCTRRVATAIARHVRAACER